MEELEVQRERLPSQLGAEGYVRLPSREQLNDEQRTGTPFANPTNAILIHQVCFDHMNDNMKLYMISALQV